MSFTEDGDILEGAETVRFYSRAGSLIHLLHTLVNGAYLWSLISAMAPMALEAIVSGDSRVTTEFGVFVELLHNRSREVICVSSSCIRCGIHEALYEDFAVWSRSCTKVVASRIVCWASIRNFQP